MFISRAVPRQDVWGNPDMLYLFKNSYSVHQAVWGFFLGDADKKRDFLYRYDYKNGIPVIYIVSKDLPVTQHGLWKVDTKEYSPCISDGDFLSFTVRVNPVVTKKFVDEKSGKLVNKRHDVVMDYKFRCHKNNIPFNYGDAVSKTGAEWLLSRCEKYGFSVKEGNITADSYERRVFEKTAENGNKCEAVIATLDLSGVLNVTDSNSFVDMLYYGIGPGKGFGCGLMLVKRFG